MGSLGLGIPPHEWLYENLVRAGISCMQVSGEGVTRHEVTDVWIDEYPTVGTIGWRVQNRLNWATILIYHHFGIQRDLFFKDVNQDFPLLRIH